MMTPKLRYNNVVAQIGAIDSLLSTISPTNFASKIGLEEKKAELQSVLSGIQIDEEKLANISLYFGGKPVDANRSIDADFATAALSSYQDIITKIWKEGSRDPSQSVSTNAAWKDASHLHITNVVRGSFGFVLEEVDYNGTPLFRSALKEAMDKAVEIIAGLADQDDDVFSDAMAVMDSNVLNALRNFYKIIYKSEAVFRMVEGNTDQTFNLNAVERAYQRTELTTVEDEEFSIDGELLGVIPIARRFEFKRSDDGSVLAGKVGLLFSRDYLERVNKEQLTGRRCKGFFQKRKFTKLGSVREVFVLTKLEGL